MHDLLNIGRIQQEPTLRLCEHGAFQARDLGVFEAGHRISCFHRFSSIQALDRVIF
jgi:hypothetical protein